MPKCQLSLHGHKGNQLYSIESLPQTGYLTVAKQSPLAFLSALDHGIFTSILCGTLPEST